MSEIVKFREQLTQHQENLLRLLPSNVDGEVFYQVVLTAVAENPALLKANRGSLWTACKQAARAGLMPDGREGAMVTFKTNVGTRDSPRWVEKVQFMPMIEGIVAQVLKSPEVLGFIIKAKYENEPFKAFTDQNGDRFEHSPIFDDSRGELSFVYAFATLASGFCILDAMPKSEVEAIKSKSRAKNSGPWADKYGYVRMAMKSVGHRLAKRLPITDAAAAAINAENSMYHDGKPQEVEDSTTDTSSIPDDPDGPNGVAAEPEPIEAVAEVVDEPPEPEPVKKAKANATEPPEDPFADADGYQYGNG